MSPQIREIVTITNESARRIVDAAIAAAQATGHPAAIAVVDAAGGLTALSRMDGAPVQTIQLAHDKAYTAAGFGMPTGQWHELMDQDAPLALGAPAMERLIPFGGGLPIVDDGRVVGGIGVAGGHWSQDAQIAETALAQTR